MTELNAFQQAAIDMSVGIGRRIKRGRVVSSLDGIRAKPMSWFVEPGQTLMLDLIARGEIAFVVCDDVLLIPIDEIDPYMPSGHEWE